MLPPSSAPPEAHTVTPSYSLQVQPSDSLEPEFTRKCQSLLKRWREKVFALMVQLKAQKLEHRACVEQLKGQVTCPSFLPYSSPQLTPYIRDGIQQMLLNGYRMLGTQP